MARGQRDRSKERHWRHHVAAWRRSGQSVRAYCAAEGLAEPSFYAWRRALAERERCGGTKTRRGTSADPTAVCDAASAFVPVRLVEEAPAVAAVEVVLRGGRVVRVAAGFTAETLRAVVAALEDLPC
jgi:transposase